MQTWRSLPKTHKNLLDTCERVHGERVHGGVADVEAMENTV